VVWIMCVKDLQLYIVRSTILSTSWTI
jgi:hypothetical protein